MICNSYKLSTESGKELNIVESNFKNVKINFN